MDKIKSLEDLKRIREEALQKRNVKASSGQKQIIVGMGTVGIASGARGILKAILEYIEKNNLPDIVVRQTGNLGLDSWEPIVQVILGEEPPVSYGRVTPENLNRIMKEHVEGGKIIKDLQVPS
jgi:NADP-reducing hydrogenase subunit HndB